MKKIAMFLAALMLVSLAACAQSPAAEPTPAPESTGITSPSDVEIDGQNAVCVQGEVVEITDEGIVFETANGGRILALRAETTVFDTDADIALGDFIFVDYNGMMTKSIPAQITADVIRMHRLSGDIVEIYADENAVLLGTTESGEVYVRLPEEWKDANIDCEHMTVYFDGVMTMSLPAQINASMVIAGYSAQGTIAEINEGSFLLDDGERQIEVLFGEGQMPETAKPGDVVRVIYNGQQTKSSPAQISAMQIVQVSR